MITGMRGLCNGLGPAFFGLIFYTFHVDLNEDEARLNAVDKSPSASSIVSSANMTTEVPPHRLAGHSAYRNADLGFFSLRELIPGPPFVFGSLMVVGAIAVALFIPERQSTKVRRQGGSDSDLIDLENPPHPGQNPSQTTAPLIPQDPAIL